MMGVVQHAVWLAVLPSPCMTLQVHSATSVKPLPQFLTEAFNDINSGLSVVVGGSVNGTSDSSSVSILTEDLPLGLFAGIINGDVHGTVLHRAKLQNLCTFPTNGNTNFRQNVGPAANSTLPSKCGMFEKWQEYEEEFLCNYSSDEYASRFYNRPLKTAILPFPGTKWELTGATCHFVDVNMMLSAQKALLQRCMSTPPSTTSLEWKLRLGKSGPTLWNEAVVTSYQADAVAGIFWAHKGPFRSPQIGDVQVCEAAQKLKDAGGKLPVIEFANFPLEMFHSPDSLKAWNDTLHNGGYQTVDHFQMLNNTEFLSLLESDICKKSSTAASFFV
eukprot:gnl/MRDRNA2_/MRDRNA2_92487_c0_seq1.p1 gnl/MRDRNA2_/MRDRNA2_92487_c0~~gnl/MRDRNA2_/MRDRNA2_92487_c0_seq1.p1  ORF type:complete len:331 (+),score=60.01 gnl/MRDRNA2_/MRDRNA2_92487_c0_seq1:87-1079(+)